MNKAGISVKSIAVLGLAAALLLLSQISLAFLPNVELVSTLLIVYTLVFQRRTLIIIYLFALLEGLIYGFGLWWFSYLYVWTILYLAIRLLSFCKNTVLLAVVSGLFGLSFGFLCAISYALAGGIGAGIAWWISGIPFDIAHGIGNFVLSLLLLKPLLHVCQILKKQNLV